MLDIDFVRNPVLPDKTIIYFYRSGYLRPDIKVALRETAAKKGWVAKSANASDPRSRGENDSLFPVDNELIYCDWGDVGSSFKEPEIFQRLHFVSDGSSSTAQIIRWDERFTEQAFWSAIQKNCFIITEPEVDGESLPHILRFLDETSGLLPRSQLWKNREFVGLFRELSDTPQLDLAFVASEYYRQVLSCTDPGSRQFDPSLHQEMRQDKIAPSPPLRRLKKFIADPATDVLDAFVGEMGKIASDEQWQPDQLYSELCNLTRRALEADARGVIREEQKRNPAGTATSDSEDMVVWVGLLTAARNSMLDYTWTRVEPVRGPKMLLAHFHELGRQFQKRRAPHYAEPDPLREQWALIEAACAKPVHNSRVRNSMLKLARAYIDWYSAVRVDPWAHHLLTAFESLRRQHDVVQPP